VFSPQRFAILTPCIKDSLLTPGSQRVITHKHLCVKCFRRVSRHFDTLYKGFPPNTGLPTCHHTQTPVREMFSTSIFLLIRILQLKTPQMHKNTIKSVIVTHDNSTMFLPHFNTNFLSVNTMQPRRVKMKASNLQHPLSCDRGDHPTTKYTTFNTEMSHMQEHQTVATFSRENSNPCKLALDVGLRHLSQQHSDIQHNATPRQQGRFTSARFLTRNTSPAPSYNGENSTTDRPTTCTATQRCKNKDNPLQRNTPSTSIHPVVPIGLTNMIKCRLHSQTTDSLPK
jgi:hypothetical protein